MEYYDNCPACGNPVMRVVERKADIDEGTLVLEDCQTCGHQDAYIVLIEGSDAP